MKIEDFKPAPYNPRKITDKAAQGLRYSLAEFGDLSGIVLNRRTGHIVSGHQRFAQLKELGAELREDDSGSFFFFYYDGKRYKIRVVDWDIEKEKAANLTANNQSIAGEFTPGVAGVARDAIVGMSIEYCDEIGLVDMVEDLGLELDELVDLKPLESVDDVENPDKSEDKPSGTECPNCGELVPFKR